MLEDSHVDATGRLVVPPPIPMLSFDRGAPLCASAEFGDKVIFRTIDTFDKGAILEWGICDGVFIDGKAVQEGQPPSYEEIREKIGERVREPGEFPGA